MPNDSNNGLVRDANRLGPERRTKVTENSEAVQVLAEDHGRNTYHLRRIVQQIIISSYYYLATPLIVSTSPTLSPVGTWFLIVMTFKLIRLLKRHYHAIKLMAQLIV